MKCIMQVTQHNGSKWSFLLILFALIKVTYAISIVPPQITYDPNEIRYLFLAESQQILCRSNGDVEIYTNVFEKRKAIFSVGEIKSRDIILFYEKDRYIAKIAETITGMSISFYNIDTGKLINQGIIDGSRIYDFKTENDQLYYTREDGYYVYDFQSKTPKRLISFSSYSLIDTVKMGMDNINCVLFGEMQIVGIDKNGKMSWKKTLDADKFCIERHFTQPNWPNCILFYGSLDDKQKIYRCISLLDGKDIWEKANMPYSSLRGISSNGQYQAWFNKSQLYFTQMPDEKKTILVPSINEERDVLFDLKNKIAVCIPSLKITYDDKKKLIYSRSSHVLDLIDLNNGNTKSKISLK